MKNYADVKQISNKLGDEMETFGSAPTRYSSPYAIGDNDPLALGFRHNGMSLAEVAAAQSNDANFDASHLSEPLTQFVSRIADEDGLEEELDSIAPPVPVGRYFSYLKADPAQDFQKDDADDSDIRAIGGEFQKLFQKGTQDTGKTDNKGLIIILDHDQNGRDPAVRENAVKLLKNRLLRSDHSRFFSALSANANGSTYSSATINWGASNTSADPDNDLMQLALEASDDLGTQISHIITSGTNWARRFSALANKANPALTVTRTMTQEQIAQLLMIRKLITTSRRYQSGMTMSTATPKKTQIAGTNIYTAFVDPDVNPQDKSNIKRFVTMQDGGKFRVWMRENAKTTEILVEHYSTIKAIHTLGLKKCAITYT